MKRYDLEQCEGYGASCNARMVQYADGDYVDAKEALSEITRLQAEVENVTQERDRLAKDALTALAGVVCTPIEGFVKVPAELKSGIHELRAMYEKAEKERDEQEAAKARKMIEVAKLTVENAELRAYADKLADSLPEGKLPKDVELQIAQQARQEAAREILNKIFQINGPSRAISKLRKEYGLEQP